jgi:hypothetical protein
MADKFEYFVRRTGSTTFEVAKFPSMGGGEQPERIYKVSYNAARDDGKCDCPAGMYRGTGKNDKHVQIVKEWIKGGEQILAIIR